MSIAFGFLMSFLDPAMWIFALVPGLALRKPAYAALGGFAAAIIMLAVLGALRADLGGHHRFVVGDLGRVVFLLALPPLLGIGYRKLWEWRHGSSAG